ncbi:hypothetical protein E4U54_008757 [Claviceps lovelessii]|nr:hypothetical protein E4U54_008757 [Claviceps lovelessii]
MPSTLSLSDEHGSYLQGLHHNSVRGRNIAPISSPHKHHGSTPSTVLSSMPFSEEKENATAGQEDLSSLASPTLDENGQNSAHVNIWSSDSAAQNAAFTCMPLQPSPAYRPPGPESVTDLAADLNSLDACKWPALPQPCHIASDTPEFLERIERALRIDDASLAAPLPCKTAPVRSASSSYPSPGYNTPRVRSPVSEHHPANRLSFSGLSRFGRANDTLSNLQSNSPASATSATEGLGDTSHHELVADTAAAITEWQNANQPLRKMTYNNYALTDSSELFPSDSLSQKDSVSLSPSSPPPTPSGTGSAAARVRATATATATETATTSREALDGLYSLGHQYDGILEARRNGSSEVKYRPPRALNGTTPPFSSSKRKASTFSLRSLTRSLTKRRRLAAIRHWASKVYHKSSRRLTEAYRRFKSHHQMPSAGFNKPWNHEQQNQEGGGGGAGGGGGGGGIAAAHLDGVQEDKPRGSNAIFGFERQRRSEDWWKDGVSRYRAPSGMFGK